MSTPPPKALLAAGAVGTVAYTATRRLLAARDFGRSEQLVALAVGGLAASHVIDAVHFLRIFVQDLLLSVAGGSRKSVLEPDKVTYRCWPADIDRNGHMNNAKFLRVVNYARRRFWTLNGMWGCVRDRSPPTNMVVTASTIRYRREIRCYARYAVVTRLLYWDKASFFIEHRFEGLEDGFVLAVSLVKYRLVGADRPTPVQLLAAVDRQVAGSEPLEPPPELVAFIRYDELSSAKLRPPAGGP